MNIFIETILMQNLAVDYYKQYFYLLHILGWQLDLQANASSLKTTF